MKLLKGKPVADWIITNIKEKLTSIDGDLTLAIVRIGEDPGDKWYQDFATKRIEELGITAENLILDKDTKQIDAEEKIKSLSKSPDINGILLLSNIPEHLDLDGLLDEIDPNKDVDGLTTYNMGKLIKSEDGLRPVTPQAVVRIIDHYDIDLEGKDVLVIGRSQVVGLPLSIMALEKNATVEIAHSRTQDLKNKLKDKDVVISAAGMIGALDLADVRSGAVVIDVGTNMDEDGNMVGDVVGRPQDDISLTPVPGGVGSVTTAVLIENLIKAYFLQNKNAL